MIPVLIVRASRAYHHSLACCWVRQRPLDAIVTTLEQAQRAKKRACVQGACMALVGYDWRSGEVEAC